MPTLERAIEIAARAHAGQVDKAGQPYILHPLRVMFRVNTERERMAAVLHDVVEDTAVTIEQLTAEGFPAEVVEAVFALTKTNGESRISAAKRAAANPIARAVKLADLAENMDLSRIPQPTEQDHARVKEYEQVREILLASTVRRDRFDPFSWMPEIPDSLVALAHAVTAATRSAEPRGSRGRKQTKAARTPDRSVAKAKPRSIKALIKAIKALPSDEPRVTAGKRYKTQKEHWLGWLEHYHSPGAYGRKVTAGRTAEFAYNHVVEPKMLFWLAGASGVDARVVATGKRSAARAKTKMSQAGVFRKHVPWSMVQAALWE